MLILVGVTINVALNGGLFQSADKAAKQTQKEADREILQAAVIAALNEQLKIEKANAILKNLPDGWDVTGADGGPYTCTSPKENVFIVYKIGEITEPWVDNGNRTFTRGDTTVEIGKTYTNEEFEDLLKEEYTGEYIGDWQVIGLEGGRLKLVSTENVSDDVILGYDDQNVYKTNVEGNPILDGEGNKILKDEIVNSNVDGDLELKKAAWSYAHVVDTLDEVAQKATKIESARSITIDDIYDIIGEKNVDKSSNSSYGETYKFYCDDTTCNNTSSSKVYSCKKKDDGTWTTGGSIASNPSYAKFTYVNNKKETGTIGTLTDETKINKGEVELTSNWFDYTLDPEIQQPAIGSLATGLYWLASPCVRCFPSSAYFGVHSMRRGGIDNGNLFCSFGNTDYRPSRGVRAVVSI